MGRILSFRLSNPTLSLAFFEPVGSVAGDLIALLDDYREVPSVVR